MSESTISEQDPIPIQAETKAETCFKDLPLPVISWSDHSPIPRAATLRPVPPK